MKQIILHLSLIEDIGPAVVGALVNRHAATGDLALIYQMSAHDLRAAYNFSAETAQKIVVGLQDAQRLDKELELIEKHQFQWATAWCAQYPKILKEIHLPPTVLYWHGTLEPDERNAVAFVGSRKVNAYGNFVIEQLVVPIVQAGWTIVSGGALGADTCAHKVTLEHGGKTVAVLGSGLLCQYPPSNKKLFAEIAANGGAVVSSFPLTMEALPGNFPARNRIISGLSRGSVVVQAAQKSGALITARYALDQGREVFAVPGSIADPLSAGCHGLIAQGAKLVTTAQDILTEFGQECESSQQMIITDSVLPAPKAKPIKKEPVPQGPIDMVMQACVMPISLDDIAGKTGLSFCEVQDILFELQLENRVEQNYAGMWQSTSIVSV